MDPRILQMLQQQGGQPQGMPQEGMPQIGGEQSFGDPRFDQNPFEAILGGGAPQGQPMPEGPHMMPDGQMMGGAPQGQELPPMGAGDQPPAGPAMGMEIEDDTQKGINPGGTKFVIGAIQQLNNFVTDSTDRSDIATVRSVIALLTRLVQKDQERQIMLHERMAQGGMPQGQAPQGPMA